jgi:hypothetical protein
VASTPVDEIEALAGGPKYDDEAAASGVEEVSDAPDSDHE